MRSWMLAGMVLLLLLVGFGMLYGEAGPERGMMGRGMMGDGMMDRCPARVAVMMLQPQVDTFQGEAYVLAGSKLIKYGANLEQVAETDLNEFVEDPSQMISAPEIKTTADGGVFVLVGDKLLRFDGKLQLQAQSRLDLRELAMVPGTSAYSAGEYGPPPAEDFVKGVLSDKPRTQAEGTVAETSEFTWQYGGETHTGRKLTLQKDDGQTVVVLVGPDSYLEQHNLAFQEGQRVTVHGWQSDHAGEAALVARTMETDDQAVVLRSVHGYPEWLAPRYRAQPEGMAATDMMMTYTRPTLDSTADNGALLLVGSTLVKYDAQLQEAGRTQVEAIVAMHQQMRQRMQAMRERPFGERRYEEREREEVPEREPM